MSEVTDKGCTKQYLITGLKLLKAILNAAAPVCPILSVGSSVIQMVLELTDNEDIEKMKQNFDCVEEKLNETTKKFEEVINQIRKGTLDNQFEEIEGNLRNQFRKFEEAKDKNSKDEFVKTYNQEKGDQNLHTMYDSVMGKSRKLFSRPILEVYMSHSKNDRHTMEHLCNRLNYHFCIGLISLMAFSEIIEDDMEALTEEWKKKMVDVQEKMKEELEKCNA